jgi:hypothetical protein
VQENFTQPITRSEVVPIIQPIGWQQCVTPIILGQINNLPFSFYPMWYNVIPLYLPFDPSLYLRYFSGMKMFEHVYPKTIIGYMIGYPYPRSDQPMVTTSSYPYSTWNLGYYTTSTYYEST